MSTDAKREGNKRYLSGQDDIKIRVPKGRREELKEIAKERFNMSLPVSYTHLDVYKRQREKWG